MKAPHLAVILATAIGLGGCGSNNATNNGNANNGAANNGATNNGTANNGATNNGAANNNGTANNGTANNGGTNNGATNNGATNNGTTNNGTTPEGPITVAECFDFSLDPDVPLAIDGVFDATSETWRRPHGDALECPASGLLPDGEPGVPYVAYAFCNTDTVPHTFDFEMVAFDGPNGEAPLDDPVLFLYDGQGVPADRLQCLAVNDDIPDAIDATDSLIEGVVVQPGQAITTVATTFQFDVANEWGTGYYVLVVTNAD